MGVEEALLQEELEDGHEAQLKRCRTNYRGENSDAMAIFEYGWVLTRASSEMKPDTVKEGIRILKALQFEQPRFSGFIYIAIAKAYKRLGQYQKARQHAQLLIQTFPKNDPERNENLRKAIELHRSIRDEISSSGWRFYGILWAVGLAGFLGYSALSNSLGDSSKANADHGKREGLTFSVGRPTPFYAQMPTLSQRA